MRPCLLSRACALPWLTLQAAVQSLQLLGHTFQLGGDERVVQGQHTWPGVQLVVPRVAACRQEYALLSLHKLTTAQSFAGLRCTSKMHL